jgi:hypothetical protein
MKHIVRLRPGRYVQLDSYGESHETPGSQLLVLVLGVLISALTVGALFGADITQFNPQHNNGNTQR